MIKNTKIKVLLAILSVIAILILATNSVQAREIRNIKNFRIDSYRFYWTEFARKETRKNYVMNFEDSKIFLNKIVDLLEFLIPKYKAEGKNMLTIGVGCTGGKHRSVYIAEQLGKYFQDKGKNVKILHRSLEKHKK